MIDGPAPPMILAYASNSTYSNIPSQMPSKLPGIKHAVTSKPEVAGFMRFHMVSHSRLSGANELGTATGILGDHPRGTREVEEGESDRSTLAIVAKYKATAAGATGG